MLNLEELKADRNLVNKIDWTMTQEKAIEMYLEWGTGWIRGHDFVSYMGQESFYFVIYDWEDPPQVTLLRRTTEGTEELAKVPVPEDLFKEAVKEDGYKPGVGVHSLNQNLKACICSLIDGPPLDNTIH
ncbi:MAG: DVU0772 family protein [Candidatus Thorarchaeota archaeon]